MKLMNWRI